METATIFIGSDVSGSHERRMFKFSVSLWDVVSCKGTASSLIPRVSLSSFLSVSIVVKVVGPEGISCLSNVLH